MFLFCEFDFPHSLDNTQKKNLLLNFPNETIVCFVSREHFLYNGLGSHFNKEPCALSAPRLDTKNDNLGYNEINPYNAKATTHRTSITTS